MLEQDKAGADVANGDGVVVGREIQKRNTGLFEGVENQQEMGSVSIGAKKILEGSGIKYTDYGIYQLGEYYFVKSQYKRFYNKISLNEQGRSTTLLDIETGKSTVLCETATECLPSYGCLLDKNGNNLTELFRLKETDGVKGVVDLFDDKNVLMEVVIGEQPHENGSNVSMLHYRIEDGQARLINSFGGYLEWYGLWRSHNDEKLASEKLAIVSVRTVVNGRDCYVNCLYSYNDGNFLGDGYEHIITTTDIEKWSRGFCKKYNNLDETLVEIMRKNNWLLVKDYVSSDIGYRGGEDNNPNVSGTIFGFIGKDGLPATDIFYLDENNDVIIYPIKKMSGDYKKVLEYIKNRLDIQAQEKLRIANERVERQRQVDAKRDQVWEIVRVMVPK